MVRVLLLFLSLFLLKYEAREPSELTPVFSSNNGILNRSHNANVKFNPPPPREKPQEKGWSF
jgi:hypothetical protein